MSGDNCSVVGCGTCRRHKGVGIFKIPSRKGQFYEEWREKLLLVVAKDRFMDAAFKDQIRRGKVFVCEKHFRSEEIEFTKTGKKTLKLGAVPTLCLPHSKDNKESCSRRVVLRQDKPKAPTCIYKFFPDVVSNLNRLKLDGWKLTQNQDMVVLESFKSPYIIPQLKVMLDDSLGFSVAAYEYLLPDDHHLYKTHFRSVRHLKVATLLSNVEALTLCCGIKDGTSTALRHIIPRQCDPFGMRGVESYSFKEYIRSPHCLVLCGDAGKCPPCLSLESKTLTCSKRKSKVRPLPASLNAPVSKTNPARLKKTLQNQRSKIKSLEREIERLKLKIQTESVPVDKDLTGDLFEIASNNTGRMSPFMKLFWEEQKKALSTSPGGMRYHPMIIRFCLSLVSKSAAAYSELRGTNLLRLPSQRTLRDYRNALSPKAGFSPELIQQLIEETNDLFDVQRYIVISIDEMKIQSNLVFDKNSEKLIGFLDLGDPDLNYSAYQKSDALATHALAFFIRGVATDLKFNFAYFATSSVTSAELYSLFWKAVSILELTCNLWVIRVVSDGASANRKFYRQHSELDGCSSADVVYKTVNLFARHRFIYFFADAPHLLKTARNCLFNSGFGKYSRCMWNNGKYILWSHISHMYYTDLENGLKILPKLTNEHVKLTPFSKMRVNLAAQVLSHTMANALRLFGTEEFAATAEYCDILNKFFDCLNVRSTSEGDRKRNVFLKPYSSLDDERFQWLTSTFLPYFEEWKDNIKQRSGNFCDKDRERMFISEQTYEGLKITVYSVIEATKFLLQEGCEFIFTERFNQDALEEYFGQQRAVCRAHDNPDMRQFGYNSNTLRIKRYAPTLFTGNTKGKYKGKRKTSWWKVEDKTFPKKKPRKKSVA